MSSQAAQADPLAAVCAYLKATIGDIINERAFRPDLPESEDQFMPRACIVVRHAGGGVLYGDSYLPITDPRIDFACYGANANEADRVARAVMTAMKRLNNETWENCKMFAANISAGPLPSFEPATLWPLSILSVQLFHIEDEVNPEED